MPAISTASRRPVGCREDVRSTHYRLPAQWLDLASITHCYSERTSRKGSEIMALRAVAHHCCEISRNHTTLRNRIFCRKVSTSHGPNECPESRLAFERCVIDAYPQGIGSAGIPSWLKLSIDTCAAATF